MHLAKTLTATVAAVALASASHAGGLSPEITEAPVVMEQEMAPTEPSLSPAIIVVGVLGALLLAASLREEDEELRVIGCEPLCISPDDPQ